MTPAAKIVPLASWRSLLAALAVVLIGTVLRVAWNDVPEYSRADETVYLEYARSLSANPAAYPQVVRTYIANPDDWAFPLPSRFAGIAITTAACTVAPCTYRTLAWIETLAGIAAILVTYLIGRTLFGQTAAIVAAGLTATCPIQLAMGRRALEDELFLLTILCALWATVEIAKATVATRRLLILGITAFTLAFAMKETFLLSYPALAAVLLILRRTGPRLGDAALFLMPPLIFAGLFGVLSGDPLSLVTLAGIQQAGRSMPYVQQFQSGPPWEPLVDIYILAPLVTVAALVSTGMTLTMRAERRPAAAIGAYVALLLVGYVFIPKDARYFMAADAGMRMLAAGGLASVGSLLRPVAPLLIAGAVVANGVLELFIFSVVFLRGNVYDPVLANLLRALDAIPR
jgi:dolichyl-phosphate-mannose-protein mannosyltransferase